MNRNKLVSTIALVLVLAGLIVGLTTVVSARSKDDSATVDLDGTSWVLSQIGSTTPTRDSNVTLTFASGKASGNATCNRFSGAYEVEGTGLSFGPLMTTMMACPDLDQETDYLAALALVTSYRVAQDQLHLLDSEGTTVLAYEPQRTSLTGTSWQLTAYSNGSAMVSVLANTQITASFDGERITGSAGCNSYFAAFETDGSQLTVGPAGSTEMFCGQPEGVMEQEMAYLQALQAAASYQVEGRTLTLLAEDGTRLALFTLAGE